MTTHLTKPIFVVGFMGAGKTTAVRKLARKLGLSGVDSDVYIARSSGMNSSDYIREYGEAAFRAAEIEAIRSLVYMQDSIISMGGGSIENEECRSLVKQNGYVVYLKISAYEASQRIGNLSTRPLFESLETAEELNQRRSPLYEDVADCTINVAHYAAGMVIEEIIKHLKKDGILLEDSSGSGSR